MKYVSRPNSGETEQRPAKKGGLKVALKTTTTPIKFKESYEELGDSLNTSHSIHLIFSRISIWGIKDIRERHENRLEGARNRS